MKGFFLIVNVLALLGNIFYIGSIVVKIWPESYLIFFFFTYLSLMADTIYLAGLLYFKFRDMQTPGYTQNNSYYILLVDHFYKYVAIMTWSVCVGYWGFVLAGPQFMPFSNGIDAQVGTFYVHLVITLIIWADAFVTPRNFVENLKVDFAISIAGNIFYSLLLITAKDKGFIVYPYLKIINQRQNVLINILSYMVTIIGYVIFKNVVKKLNKKSLQVEEEGVETLIS